MTRLLIALLIAQSIGCQSIHQHAQNEDILRNLSKKIHHNVDP